MHERFVIWFSGANDAKACAAQRWVNAENDLRREARGVGREARDINARRFAVEAFLHLLKLLPGDTHANRLPAAARRQKQKRRAVARAALVKRWFNDLLYPCPHCDLHCVAGWGPEQVSAQRDGGRPRRGLGAARCAPASDRVRPGLLARHNGGLQPVDWAAEREHYRHAAESALRQHARAAELVR